MKIIIVGLGIAGITAAKKIRSFDPNCEITLISSENYPHYIRPQLPLLVTQQITLEKIQQFSSDWYQENNFKLLLNSKVTAINPDQQFISINDQNLFYDKLLLAVGARPFFPPIPGIQLPNVFALRTMEDALKIQSSILNKKKNIVCIGAGLLGLEIASLLAIENNVSVINNTNNLLAGPLNPQQSQRLESLLEKENGLKFYHNTTCQNILQENEQLTIISQKDQKISADLIIIATGIKANIELAISSGLKTEQRIMVDQYLQTSHSNIYAAGDCIQLENQVWGFVKSAREQGEIAAENMIKNNCKPYYGSQIKPVAKLNNINFNSL